ncbi:MAG: acyloxyacyl hydrolase [Rhodospirillaceae bacterium]|nr:acyloxyacyl hydrolase [Rhodospirillaceae bacterium]MBT4939444.1 acyloxyacyl hydrolase [Rhodospirillaceae bacterium]MBT5940578.1 acyloxyacyl hydrolase [Rhodospirillaceae bacterium]MBT7267842.1 acyloxyacyl hydrolase [Rhodospirillaceae bacterium]
MQSVFQGFLKTAGFAAIALLSSAGAGSAGTAGGVYDMSRFLNQPHPFAKMQTAPRPDLGDRTVRSPANPQSDQSAPARRMPAKPIHFDSADRSGSQNIISEVRIGALIHDEGPFSHRKETGYDANLEILFTSPEILKKIWAPRPHIGASYNSAGDTNQAYLGLTWEWMFFGNYFANFSLGGGYHDGYKVTDKLDRKSLGCSILFRESLDIGYRFGGVHSIMAHLDHISNAKLCSTNEGLESVGIRYGYHF